MRNLLSEGVVSGQAAGNALSRAIIYLIKPTHVNLTLLNDDFG